MRMIRGWLLGRACGRADCFPSLDGAVVNMTPVLAKSRRLIRFPCTYQSIAIKYDVPE